MEVLTDIFSGQKQVQFQSILGLIGKENDAFNIQVRSMTSLSTENHRKCTKDASNFQSFLGEGAMPPDPPSGMCASAPC